jgi:hypothetical protein
MKRIGFFLIAVFLFTAVNAQINLDSLRHEIKNEVIKTSERVHELQKDSILLAKLTPEQLIELKKQEKEVEMRQIEADSKDDMPLNGLGIVIICIAPFLFTIIIIAIFSTVRNKESKRKHDLYLKSLEMGQTIPEHFFDSPKKPQSASSNLKKGVLWLAVGLALVIYFVTQHNNFALIAGLIPTFVGAGYLLVHFLEKPKNTDEQHG